MTALPKLAVLTHEITLPLSKKKIKFRPFEVSEEKILLMAMETKDKGEIAEAMINVLKACTFDKIKIEQLPSVDVEYLIIQLRAQSKDDKTELNYRCKNKVNDNPCNHLNTFYLDLQKDLIIDSSKILDDKLQLEEGIGIKLKPPLLGSAKKLLADESTQIDTYLDSITDCIEYVWSGDEIIKPSDISEEELDDFVTQISTKKIQYIRDYVESLPKITADLDFKCQKCGYEEKIHLGNIHDFLE